MMRSLSSSYQKLQLPAGLLLRQQKVSKQGSYFLQRDEVFGRYHHHHHSFSTASLSSFNLPPTGMLRKDEQDQQPQQRRRIHSSPKNEMVLYGTIILVTTFGYIAYRKYNGLPLKPESVTESQSAYQKMEEDRRRRNEKHSNKQ